jgi:hypothetical protein
MVTFVQKLFYIAIQECGNRDEREKDDATTKTMM